MALKDKFSEDMVIHLSPHMIQCLYRTCTSKDYPPTMIEGKERRGMKKETWNPLRSK